MLKKIRVTLAIVSILLVTLLFVDFTGMAHVWFGWMAKIQFLPALLALNFGVIIALVVLTLLLGRIYCSVICPLGIMQDVFAYFGKKSKKNRYSYSPGKNILRYVLLAVMLFAILAGISSIVVLLAPYSAYGRMVQSLFAPVVAWVNNLFATWAENHESYAFYSVDVWLRSGITLGVAIATLVILGFLAASPYILYQMFLFVSPALYDRERKYATGIVTGGYLMFLLGTALSYFIIFPMTFRFLGTYQVAGDVVNMISLESYMSTLVMLCLCMGFVCEMPVLAWLLTKAGLLTHSFLSTYRRHAIVVILIAAAIITPTSDVFTLMLVSIPMQLLYEASILVSKIAAKKRQRESLPLHKLYL